MDLIGLPKRGGLLYAAQRSVGIVTSEGEPIDADGGGAYRRRDQVLMETSPAADFRSGKLDFLVSEDGKTVQFMDYRSRNGEPLYLTFEVGDLRLSEGEKRSEAGLKAAELDASLVKIDFDSQSPPEVFGKQLEALTDIRGDAYRSAATHAEKKRLLLGSSDYLRVIDLVGRAPVISCEMRIEFEAFRVNLVSDGTLAVVGHSDGTLRWYKIVGQGKTCKLHQLLAAHISKNTSGEWSWSAWVPSGQFANDTRAENLFGWQSLNDGGEVQFLPRSDRLDLYSRETVIKALDPGVSIPKAFDLSPTSHEFVSSPTTSGKAVVPFAPDEFAEVTDAAIEFRVKFLGSGKWPRKLTLKTGRGVGMSLISGGKTYNPGEPVTVGKGKARFKAILPASARYTKGISHVCFYLDGVRQVCRGVEWAGQTAQRPKRKLWAVLVGVSEYQHKKLNLNSAHNDAIDFAKLFVSDFENRGVGAGHEAGAERDFEAVNIDLIVSPPTASQTASQEISDLASRSFVKTHPATRAGVIGALDELVRRDRNEELSNDLIVFYFSGHGYVHPYNDKRGKSLFLTSETNPVFSKQALASTSIDSADLLSRLSKISGEKLVIIDACRVPYSIDSKPFDPTLVKLEFIENLFSAHYFFSAQAGQYSIDQSAFVIDAKRPATDRGNGVFTYSLLKALKDRNADLKAGRSEYYNRIDVIEAKLFVDQSFDLQNPDSVIRQLNAKRQVPLKVLQQPTYIPSRGAGALSPLNDVSVLRTLDPE
jgi:hypothetical protein